MNRPPVLPEPASSPLAALRTELVDLAFALERQGRLDAADLAIAIAGRLGEVDTSSAPGDGPSVALRVVATR